MSDVDERTQQLDYELGAEISADTPARLKALGDPLRQLLLDLVLERAMSVSELAARVQRPKSTVAHHVDLLTDVGLLQVVRTRKVRAMEERFYGRTARTIVFPHTLMTATCPSSPTPRSRIWRRWPRMRRRPSPCDRCAFPTRPLRSSASG